MVWRRLKRVLLKKDKVDMAGILNAEAAAGLGHVESGMAPRNATLGNRAASVGMGGSGMLLQVSAASEPPTEN